MPTLCVAWSETMKKKESLLGAEENAVDDAKKEKCKEGKEKKEMHDLGCD
jgi:hypothetical protein